MNRSTPRAHRTLLVLILLALALALGATVGGAGPAGAAGSLRQQDDPEAGDDPPAGEADPFDKVADCVVENGRLQVMFLVDESDSVRLNDPDDQRVAGALTALDSIERLSGTDAEGGDIEIDVQIATFASEFTPAGEWAPLDEDSRPARVATINELADRETARDSDFHNALLGAQQSMSDQADAVREADGEETCKVVLMFADGDYLLDTRSNAQEQEDLGVTKEYAPGIELTDDEAVAEAIELGTQALCEPGGIVDQIRDDQTTVVALELGDGSDLLEAIATGTSAGGQTCGDPETDTPGVYLAVDDTDDLLATFDLVASRIAGGEGEGEDVVPCEDEVCEEGAVPFTVDSELRGVHILAVGPAADTRVVIEPPEGDPLELIPGEDVDDEVGGLPVTATWVADRTVTADLVVPEDGTGEGEWRVVLVGGEGDETGRVQVVTLARGVDQAKRLVLAVGLMAAGLILPLALLVLINVATTRFQDLSNIQAARVPVLVTPHSQIRRTDGDTIQLLRLPESDFHELEGQGGHRHFTWQGLVFRAKTPLNPFAEPHATVAVEGSTNVAREARRADIALGLAGSWMFLLDQDATRAATREGEIHGQLVAFVATETVAAQGARLLNDVEERLPVTARRLAQIAGVKGGTAIR